MPGSMIDCAEVTGKTVRRLRLATSESGSQEIHLEFTDDTAFSLVVESTTKRSARLIASSEAGQETLRSFDE
jgi:hypothetical protein